MKLLIKDVIVETYAIQRGGFMLKPANGVRLIHKPTGTVVQCDSERSQHRNRDTAWRDLEKYLAENTAPAAPAQEPDELMVAYMSGLYDGKKHAAQRQWVGLTDEERAEVYRSIPGSEFTVDGVSRAIEAKLREKNAAQPAVPLTDEQQIAEALRQHGLTLVKTSNGYTALRLGQIDAHGITEQKGGAA